MNHVTLEYHIHRLDDKLFATSLKFKTKRSIHINSHRVSSRKSLQVVSTQWDLQAAAANSLYQVNLYHPDQCPCPTSKQFVTLLFA